MNLILRKKIRNLSKIVIYLSLFYFLPSFGKPLQRIVYGKVVDAATNSPLVGATVKIKTSQKTTSTDVNGQFQIESSLGDILVINYIGYTSKEVAVGEEKNIQVVLNPEDNSLNEVVVIGYGTQKKSDLTGSVSVIKMNDVIKQPSSNITSQLQGQASGVTVLGSGQPGESPSIKIRGVNTFGNNNPLYVVDGIPYESISNLNPNDISSMQVLKDAGAASIYGSRAANGVIIITTKNGSGSDKVNINYDGYFGNQLVKGGNVWDLLNPQEMANLEWKALANSDSPIEDPKYGNGSSPKLPNYIYPVGAESVDELTYYVNPNYTSDEDYFSFQRIVKANKTGTDWYHAIFNSAPMTNHNLSVASSNNKGSYLFSLNYFNQEGTLIETYNKKYNIRANTLFNVSDRIRVGENLTFTIYKSSQVDINTSDGPIALAYRIQPIIPIYDIRGNYAGGYGAGLGDALNPVAVQERTKNNSNIGNNIFGNIFAEVDILKSLTLRSSFGGEVSSTNSHSFVYPQYENTENARINSYSESAPSSYNFTWTNMLTYRSTFHEKHNLTVIGGSEYYENRNREVGGTSLGYFSFDPDYVNLSNGSGTRTNYSYRSQYALFSIFGRADYNFDSKYLLSATVRRDGSSKFLTEKYGWFPAFSAGWRLTQESFMKEISWIDELKIRGGYGIMGNQINVDPANAYTIYSSNRLGSYYSNNGSNSDIAEGFQRSRLGNADAKWEKNKTTNFGLDATLINGAIQLSVDYYRKDIQDLLYNPELLGTAGQVEDNNYPYVNIAKMKNTGLDLSISANPKLSKDFVLNLSGTLTTYHNKILKIANGVDYFDSESLLFSGSNVIRNAINQPVSQFYGYQIDGFWNTDEEIAEANAQAIAATGDKNSVYQSDVRTGYFRYKDVNGDHQITDDDRTILGNPNPDFTYGLNLGFTYKNFDFSSFFYGSSGNDIWNNLLWWTDFYSDFNSAKSKTALYDSWTPENHNAKAPIQTITSSFSTSNVPSSYYVENGSYLRLKNVQLGYTFPKHLFGKSGIEKLHIFIQATNLFTITGYSGIDPEISGSTTAFGIDGGTYPSQRQLIFGANFQF
ncbi:TonB-linked outer membrane protein, SusC/RagA family [bacterium A37T11]|nr:TonB-linked outer membrane protein, SusC/RagA family [bacterium A37T11]